MLMFFQDGLDTEKTHTLKLQNLNDGMALSLNSVVIKQLPSENTNTSSSKFVAPKFLCDLDSDVFLSVRSSSSKVGIIVGCVIAALVLIGIAGLLFWRKRRSKHQMVSPDLGQHSPLSSPTFSPGGLRSNQRDTEGTVTPYVIDLRRSQNMNLAQPSNSRALSNGREAKDAPQIPILGEKREISLPQSSPSSQSRFVEDVQPVVSLAERSPRRAPPRSVPATYVPSEISELPVSPVVSPHTAGRSRAPQNLPSLAENDPAFVDRVLQLVVQRIDAQRPTPTDDSSHHDQPLPPYVEEERTFE